MGATLTNIKTNEVITFGIPPQRITRGYRAEYSKLNVLKTGQPLLSYQHSETSITLPSMYLEGEGLLAQLALLEKWTKPESGTLEPPTVKFEFAHYSLVAKLESVDIEEDLWIGGTEPTRATVSISLLPFVEPPKPVVKQVPTTKLSPPEQAKYATEAHNILRLKKEYQSPPLAQKDVTVNADGKVLVRGKDIGTLAEVGVKVKPAVTPPTDSKDKGKVTPVNKPKPSA